MWVYCDQIIIFFVFQCLIYFKKFSNKFNLLLDISYSNQIVSENRKDEAMTECVGSDSHSVKLEQHISLNFTKETRALITIKSYDNDKAMNALRNLTLN